MSEPYVRVSNLARRFQHREALRGVNLEVRPGSIVGLAGPNGSGKTTLLKLVAGFLRPTGGTVRVFGLDPYRERAAVMRTARFAFAPPALYESLTGREHVEHLARLGGHTKQTRSEVDRALDDVGLLERGDDRVRAYSFGMRQRIVLAQALVPEPKLLVLDEPTDGLDPLAVLELRRILQKLRRERDVTILLSSHLLIELDELVDRLVVLDEGEILFHGTPDELLGDREELVLETDAPRRAADILAKRGAPVSRSEDGSIRTSRGALTLLEASALLGEEQVELLGYRVERPTLERALLDLLRARRTRRTEEDGRP